MKKHLSDSILGIVNKVNINFVLALSIIEGIIACTIIILIPSDPKSAVLFGFSPFRLMLIFVMFLLISLLGLVINKSQISKLNERILSTTFIRKFNKYIFLLLIFSLSFLILFPPENLNRASAVFIRIKPLLIWINLVLLQYSSYIIICSKNFSLQHIRKVLEYKRPLLLLITISIIGLLCVLILSQYPSGFYGEKLAFPPGAPVSSFQLFIFGGICLVILILESIPKVNEKLTRYFPVFIILVGFIALVSWSMTPLSCADDRPGPYPPNDSCYPEINDAVFSIGAHYTSLGEGINNRWPTDKPFYILFLSISQLIAGRHIDKYLVIQIVIYAFTPIVLLILGKRLKSISSGLLSSALFIAAGVTAISLYRKIGTFNVKTEASEIITTVLLSLLFFTVFNWFKDNSEKNRWAILTGGILGIASLTRINPFFIGPFLVYFAAWLNRFKWKEGVIQLSLFSLAFFFVVLPWSLSAKDVYDNNFLLIKIQNVINSRLDNVGQTSNSIDNTELSPVTTPYTVVDQAFPNSGIINPDPKLDNAEGNLITSIIYHFINNEVTVLAKLPTQLTFYSIDKIIDGPIWKSGSGLPIWKYPLSTENIILLTINFLLVGLGVLVSHKRFGFAGLSGVLIQVGYFVGNSIAQTSGGRYIDPVSWITLLYYCIGLTSITVVFLKTINVIPSNFEFIVSKPNTIIPKSNIMTIIGNFCIFFILGFSVLLSNIQKYTLYPERDKSIEEMAYQKITHIQPISDEQWESILRNPKVIIAQGRAFHTIYNKNPEYNRKVYSIEQLILADDHVYMSFIEGIKPKKYFTDNSKVIVIGCEITRDKAWSMNRVKVNTYTVIQMDNEEQTFIKDLSAWNCE